MDIVLHPRAKGAQATGVLRMVKVRGSFPGSQRHIACGFHHGDEFGFPGGGIPVDPSATWPTRRLRWIFVRQINIPVRQNIRAIYLNGYLHHL